MIAALRGRLAALCSHPALDGLRVFREGSWPRPACRAPAAIRGRRSSVHAGSPELLPGGDLHQSPACVALGIGMRIGIQHGDEVLVGGRGLVARVELHQARPQMRLGRVGAERVVAQVPLIDHPAPRRDARCWPASARS